MRTYRVELTIKGPLPQAYTRFQEAVGRAGGKFTANVDGARTAADATWPGDDAEAGAALAELFSEALSNARIGLKLTPPTGD